MISLLHHGPVGMPDAISVGAGLLGLGLWLHFMLSVWRESLRSRKEISRYSMFAARDRLVRIVIDGEMSEENPAWRATYASVTELLKMHQRLHLVDVVSRFAKYIFAVLADPALRERVNRLDDQMKKASKTSPRFAAVTKDIEDAFRRMVGMRTSGAHMFAVRAYVFWLNLKLRLMPIRIAVAIVPDQRRSETRRARRKYGSDVARALRPSSSDIAGFSATCAA